MFRLAYTGIGSRQTPMKWQAYFTKLAARLEELGFVLRSGGAIGADHAFNAGVQDGENNAEIYLPWQGWLNQTSHMPLPNDAAFEMAKQFHPRWNALKSAGRAFHARNCYQVLGRELRSQDRSSFIICWTPNGTVAGGTGQALRLAANYDVPVFNFGGPDPTAVKVELGLHVDMLVAGLAENDAVHASYDCDSEMAAIDEIAEQINLG